MKEKAIQNKIVQYLKQQPNTWFFKTHGGMYQVAGIPDILLCYNGHFVALEIKRPGEKPTNLQEKVLRDIKEVGGIAAVVYGLSDAKELLDALAKGE